MSTSLLLQFAADHPFAAFLLSWPLAILLLGVAWSIATLMTNSMNVCVMMFNQMTNFIVMLVRGYPPHRKEDEDDDLVEKDEKS